MCLEACRHMFMFAKKKYENMQKISNKFDVFLESGIDW